MEIILPKIDKPEKFFKISNKKASELDKSKLLDQVYIL